MKFIKNLDIDEGLKAYRKIIDKINDIVLMFNKTGRIVMANNKAIETYGYTEEELLLANIETIDRLCSLERFEHNFNKSFAEEIEFEAHNYKKSGKVFPIRAKSFGIKLGEDQYSVCTVLDNTNQKRTEDEIIYLQSVSDETRDAIIGIDKNGIIKLWNKGAETIYGFSKSDMIGNSVFKEILREYKNTYPYEMKMLLDGRRIEAFEIMTTRKDGKQIYISITATPVYSNGDIIGNLFIISDITERKVLVEKLSENEERLRMAIDGSKGGVWDFNIASGEVYYSEVFEKILGYEEGEYPRDIGRYIEAVHPEDREYISKYIKEAKVGDFLSAEHRLLGKDGNYLWVNSLGRVLRSSEKNNDLRIVGLSTDITWRKNLEERLRMNEERYRMLYSSMSQGVALGECIYEDGALVDCRFISVNRSFEEITGVDNIQCKGKSVLRVFPELKSEVYKGYQKANETGIMHCFQFHCGVLNKYMDIQAYELKNGQVAMLVTDVTESVLREKQLKENFLQVQVEKERAEKASLAKTQFLANMSHELRTPMNGILGVAQLMEFTALGEEQREYINILKTSSNHLLKIINDLLDISKIEAGKETINSIEFNFRDTIEMIIQELNVIASNKKLEIMYYVDPLIDTRVVGDPVKLSQILLNLVSNAVKFTDKGHVYFKVKRLQRDVGKLMVEFSIEDTGIGISDSFRDDIFSIFTQADGSYTKKYGGTGLGLAISKKLAKAMGGDIWFESNEGKGSTFYLSLELLLPSDSKASQISNEVQINNFNTKAICCKNILVAENDLMNQVVIGKMLENARYTYSCVGNGKDVLKAMESSDYDLILMDIQMPILNGCEATRVIREKEKATGKHIPIIAMTAYAMNGDREKFIGCGVDDYIPKPIEINTLVRILEKYL